MNREQCAIHKVDIAIADKPRDAFRRQSRSPNMEPLYVRHGFLLLFYSNFVPRTHRF